MAPSAMNTEPAPDRRRYGGWLMVGFALGGFFDGIVLHQILQWHHLLSGMNEPLGSDLQFQIVMDGLFHLIMYLVAICAMVLLVSGRAIPRPDRAPSVLRPVLIGFAVWHVADAILSHWLLGLHRIRMDSETPLAWDVAWLIAFGILPLIIAFLLPSQGGSTRGVTAAVLGVMVASGLAAGAGPRFDGPSETIIVFRNGLAPAQMMAAVQLANTRLRWTDPSGTIWAVDDVSWRGLFALYANGALLVGSTPAVAGCLAWMKPA